MDLDRASVDSVASGPVGSLIRPDNIIAGHYGAGMYCSSTSTSDQQEIILPKVITQKVLK